ncbi:MAG TPA: endonuclease/exonuclease/phosphatase family protein [Thermomicrobiaceae bacterium]|nr:endonuclease/exonuclease/phosphatase family protein [Thermomicrobiaceae bacterium]
MRIVGWNIRAGGGRRVGMIAAQLDAWAPDIVALCEFRATPPSRSLAEALAARGLAFQASAVDPRQPSRNGLLVASRWPLRLARARAAPIEPCRWLLVRVDAPLPFTLGAMHIPVSVSGRKLPYLGAVERLARGWRRGAGLLIGDTNSGRPGIDEQSPVFGPRTAAWFDELDKTGWADAFRHLHGDTRVYTWYSPNAGNGFRLDQAFVNRHLLPHLRQAGYQWGQPADTATPAGRATLSDHAALLLDFDMLEGGHHT